VGDSRNVSRPRQRAIRTLIEVDDVVVAEGSVRAPRKDGTALDVVCDIFDMRDGKIRRLISYLMEA
jgi:ketosteroid isomerase-like protein